MNKQISILGCGWLGLPLAKSLLSQNYKVKGSTTTENKLALLKDNSIIPYQIQLTEEEIVGSIHDFLEKSETVIVDIPPGLRRDASVSFVAKIKLLIAEIEKSSVKNVVFVSSTSVYGDSYPIATYTETSNTNPETEGGKQLAEVEQLLLHNSIFNSYIIRFGGLIGEDRNPIRFLSGRKNVENPEAPVNLIHQTDCIGLIESILEAIEKGNLNRPMIFNAVYPKHPTRKEYYTKKAKENKLPLPLFAEMGMNGKIISSEHIEKYLTYQFKQEI